MCTSIMFKSQENKFYHGRTQEFNVDFNYEAVVIPSQYNYKMVAVDDYITKNTVLGISANGMNFLIDGVNEHGLSAVTQYFLHSNEYGTLEEAKAANKIPLAPEEVISYFLLECKTCEEVIEVSKNVAVANIFNEAMGFAMPQHFCFQDATGRKIVLEPSKKNELVVFENEVGIFTNNPPFDWQLTNLQNYVHLSDEVAPDYNYGDGIIKGVGKGSGLLGLPGDFTPPSRFVRAFFLTKMSEIPKNNIDSVNHMFHLLSTVDIPKGVIKIDNGSVQYTQYTVTMNNSDLEMYIHFYEDRAIKKLCLNDYIGKITEPIRYSFNPKAEIEKIVIK